MQTQAKMKVATARVSEQRLAPMKSCTKDTDVVIQTRHHDTEKELAVRGDSL